MFIFAKFYNTNRHFVKYINTLLTDKHLSVKLKNPKPSNDKNKKLKIFRLLYTKYKWPKLAKLLHAMGENRETAFISISSPECSLRRIELLFG